jgi:hypothetical protein
MPGLRNLAAAAALLLAGAALARAGESVEDFHRSVAAAYEPYREAVHYLETGNSGLAALALERARDEWRRVASRFAEAPPAPFAKDARWKETLAAIDTALERGLAAADSGNGEAALAALGSVRRELAELRLRGGQRVYSDCIDAMNAAMDRLWSYRNAPPARARAGSIAAFKKDAAEAERWYRRCRDEAPPALRQQGEFKRLFDGALASLARLPRAADSGNAELVVSLLRELRSFDKLIWLRFG